MFVITSLTVEAGGTTTVACGLAEALAGRGHHVTIATLATAGTPAEASVAVERFRPDREGSALAASRQMRAWLAAHAAGFDVVQIHGIWQRPGHYAAGAARAARVPYLVRPEGMLDRNSLALGRWWAKRIAWWLWDGPMARHAAAVHCLSQAEYRVSPWIHGLPTVVIGNGVARDVFDAPPRGKFRHGLKTQGTARGANVGLGSGNGVMKNGDAHAGVGGRRDWQHCPMALFLGRVHPKKGLDRFLPAWRAVLAGHPDAVLVIAGAGETAYVEALHELCRREGIEDSVVWVGQLTGRDKWAALVDADVFVLPSHQEGFSLAITEAMAAACPVVITRACNFDEVTTANAGVVVDGGDMQRFAAEVSSLLGDAERRRGMGGNGRELVRKKYTWSAIAGQMERVYEAVIAGKPLPEDLRPGPPGAGAPGAR